MINIWNKNLNTTQSFEKKTYLLKAFLLFW